jgi:hypothetical protein
MVIALGIRPASSCSKFQSFLYFNEMFLRQRGISGLLASLRSHVAQSEPDADLLKKGRWGLATCKYPDVVIGNFLGPGTDLENYGIPLKFDRSGVDRVAGSTFPAVCTAPELTFVRILVAVRTLARTF